MDRDDIELQIMELEEKFNSTRDSVEKAYLTSKISNLRKQIEEIEDSKIEKKSVFQNEAPIRADHIETKKVSNGLITNSGDTFRMLI